MANNSYHILCAYDVLGALNNITYLNILMIAMRSG